MKIYTLRFRDDGQGLARRVEFKAEDLPAALIIAHREVATRTAELWDGERKLCTVRREANENDAQALSPMRQMA
ncbi:hypothetical protein WBP06_03310 [Novosphingobium sp. BL-8H]|uniref:hypothetical protein n=1 Tax=Novosphingobium sp. BL-8H TaxID=3127640 RepID=UPI003757502C